MMRGGAAVAQATLDRLAAALAHRGPDGTGRYLDGGVGLVHTRLAIIDLDTGDQPLGLDRPGGPVLVANGEIYNDPELRAGLAGARFATGSDCESPLELYRRHGLDFTGALRGMYAIAVHDPAERRLVLARDPFGIKPLYYVETDALFAFASEPQALIAAGLARPALRDHARAELLQLKFTTGAETIFSGVRRVEPGETLVVEDGRARRAGVRAALPSGGSRRNGGAAKGLDQVLIDTVAHHLRSDVPYGLFLSGGIDSSVLAVLMARLADQPVTAFTAGFPGSGGADETAQAARMARAVGADHHLVEVTEADFWGLAPQIAAALDDPTTDAAALPSFMLARAAKGHLKVVLTGAGADEIFGGYSRYRRAAWMGPLARRSRTRGVFDPALGRIDALRGWRDGLAAASRNQSIRGRTTMQTLQAVDCAQWLPNDVLSMLDRCLMAHGVEGRTPFLDPPTAEFAFDLPDRLKVRGKFGKWILRDWLAKAAPESAAFARKQGFTPPIGHWIAARSATLQALVAAQPGVAEVFDGEAVRAVLADPVRHAQSAWSLVFYGLWHSRHVLDLPADGPIDAVLAQAARAG